MSTDQAPLGRVKLNMDTVAKAAPAMGANGRPKLTFLWDSELPRFGLQLTPAGAKSYVVGYRVGGKSRRTVLGKVSPSFTPEAARRKAKAELGKVDAHGTDLSQVKSDLIARQRADLPVNKLLDDWMGDHVRGKREASTAASYDRLLRLHVRPAIGTKRLGQVTRDDMAKLHKRIGAKHKRTANHVLAVVSSFYGWCRKLDPRPEMPHGNPTEGIDHFPEKKVVRFLKKEEYAGLGEAFASASADRGRLKVSKIAVALIRLLMLTGARRDELRTAQWEFVDIERRCITLPKHKTSRKTGVKSILLSEAAVAILATLPRVAGNPYVFPGKVAGQCYGTTALQKAKDKLMQAAGFDKACRIHDLRHNFASAGVSGGVQLLAVGKLLGHADITTTQRYAHEVDAGRRDLEAISASIAGKIGGAANGK